MTYQDDLQDAQLHTALRSAIGEEPAMRSLPMDDLARGRTKLRHRRIAIAASVAAVASAVVLVLAVAPSGLTAGPDTPDVVDQLDDETEPPFEIEVLEQAVRDNLDATGDTGWHDVAGVITRNSDADPGEVSAAYVTAQWEGEKLVASFTLSVSDPSAFATAEQRESCRPPGHRYPELTCESRELTGGGTVLIGTGKEYGKTQLSVRLEHPDGDILWASVDIYASAGGSSFEPIQPPLRDVPLTAEQLIELVQDPRVDL